MRPESRGISYRTELLRQEFRHLTGVSITDSPLSLLSVLLVNLVNNWSVFHSLYKLGICFVFQAIAPVVPKYL